LNSSGNREGRFSVFKGLQKPFSRQVQEIGAKIEDTPFVAYDNILK
jgi:hypothetical protein